MQEDLSLKIEGEGFSQYADTTNIEVLDPAVGLCRATMIYRVFPQPAWESIVMRADLDAEQYLLVDEVDIDTRCVPEPASITMVLVGALAFLGWVRFRR